MTVDNIVRWKSNVELNQHFSISFCFVSFLIKYFFVLICSVQNAHHYFRFYYNPIMRCLMHVKKIKFNPEACVAVAPHPSSAHIGTHLH